ncbi:MAG: PAS domain-containing protein [Deltaproteobacteria bacterium]|nr:PAS domain-containing protein [Deltaproteobacteria bacterium]
MPLVAPSHQPLEILEKLFSELHSSLVLLDLQEEILYLNPHAQGLLELSLPLFQGKKLPSYVRFSSEVKKALQEVLKKGRSFKLLETQLKIKARQLKVQIELAPLGSAQKPEGVLIWISPLERFKAIKEQEKVQERFNLMETLALGLAHEIRNPLGAIRAAAERLAKWLPQEKAHYSPLIVSEVDRLNQLLSQLMDLSRPQKLHYQEINLNQILDENLKLFEPQCENLGIKIEKHLDPSLPPLRADQNSLQQILTNLIKNALEAMETQGGTLSLISQFHRYQSQMGASALEIAVQDTGNGLSAEEIQKLFTPFYSTKAQGTGLGLLTTQRLIQAHGGHLEIESQAGLGSSFRIFFPLRRAKE